MILLFILIGIDSIGLNSIGIIVFFLLTSLISTEVATIPGVSNSWYIVCKYTRPVTPSVAGSEYMYDFNKKLINVYAAGPYFFCCGIQYHGQGGARGYGYGGSDSSPDRKIPKDLKFGNLDPFFIFKHKGWMSQV